MPSKKKKFVDKKAPGTAVFHVVHRSQRDPLAADHSAPQHVLKPLEEEQSAARKEEQRSFGVFFDDDYNYMQHLKDRAQDYELVPTSQTSAMPPQEAPKLQLPSSVFESSLEASEPLSSLETRGPRLDWDPDIIETLDDAFDCFESVVRADEIDQDMVDDLDQDLALALQGDEDDEEEDKDDGDVDSDDCFGSEIEFGNSKMASSRFTEYSMSSAVTRRSENLKKLDDQFEEFMEQYEDEHVGPLVLDEAADFGLSTVEDGIITKLVIDDQERKRQDQKEQQRLLEITLGVGHEEDEKDANDSNEEKEEKELMTLKPEKEKWDCESILSTYSNIYHHPKLLSEPALKKRNDKIELGPDGLPLRPGLTARNLRRLDVDSFEVSRPKTAASVLSTASTIRSRFESSDERRERKALVKMQRKERRIEKKCNQLAFKEEKQRQHGAKSSVQVRGKPIL